MRASSKKSIPVSVYDRPRLATDAEEGMDAGYHISNINPEPINLREDIVRGEGYSIPIERLLMGNRVDRV